MTEVICNSYNSLHQYYVLVFITTRCNYSCSYCYNKKNVQQCDIDFLALKKYLIWLKSICNRHIIVAFIGGEPTLYPYFLQLCNDIIHNDMSIELLTNLSLSMQFLKSINANIRITASFHAQYSNISEFVKKCETLDNVRDIIVMYDPSNLDKSIECFDQLILHTKNKNIELNLVDDYPYSKEQLDVFYKHKSSTLIYNVDGKDMQFNQIATYARQSFKNWFCYAGLDTQYIHCDGKVYLCESYYSENMNPYTSIYANTYKFIDHPIICQCYNCAGNYFIKKTKQLNHLNIV